MNSQKNVFEWNFLWFSWSIGKIRSLFFKYLLWSKWLLNLIGCRVWILRINVFINVLRTDRIFLFRRRSYCKINFINISFNWFGGNWSFLWILSQCFFLFELINFNILLFFFAFALTFTITIVHSSSQVSNIYFLFKSWSEWSEISVNYFIW